MGTLKADKIILSRNILRTENKNELRNAEIALSFAQIKGRNPVDRPITSSVLGANISVADFEHPIPRLSKNAVMRDDDECASGVSSHPHQQIHHGLP